MAVRILKEGMPRVYTGYDVHPLPVYEVTYEGAVLSTWERNGYDDSDFYATVWDDEAGEVKDVMFATTRGWTYANSATVDATDEVKAKADAWYRERLAHTLKANAEREAEFPEKGDVVVVVKGRKVPKGTVGRIFWKGEDRYKTGRFATFYRIGIETDDGDKYFLAEDNVKLVTPKPVPTLDEFRDRVKDRPFPFRPLDTLAHNATAGRFA